MTKVSMEFPLAEEDVSIKDGKLTIELGHGCRMNTTVPEWVTTIAKACLRLEFDTEGAPPRAVTDKPSVQ